MSKQMLSVSVCVSLIRPQCLASSPRWRKYRHTDRNHENDQIQAVNRNKTSLDGQTAALHHSVGGAHVFFSCAKPQSNKIE